MNQNQNIIGAPVAVPLVAIHECTVSILAVITIDRIREDLGDIDALAASIRQHGQGIDAPIQPIVIERNTFILVAGGRRLAAMTKLGVKELTHGKHYVYRDEQSQIEREAVELEENLRRKELTWQEQVAGKKRLLEKLQAIHGVVALGAPTKEDALSHVGSGFGINKLAAVLGESAAQTSKDIAIATAIEQFPALGKKDSKGAAMQSLKTLSTVLNIAAAAEVKKAARQIVDTQLGVVPDSTTLAVVRRWSVYKGDFRTNLAAIPESSVDLIHTDLPYGTASTKVGAGAMEFGYTDVIDKNFLLDVANASYKLLRPNRYAAFWFGFVTYADLVNVLTTAGFKVCPVPLVWVKNNVVVAQDYSLYAGRYEACLIVKKGSPTMMRPNQPNVKNFNFVSSANRTHANEKPVDLIHDILKDLVPTGGVVADLCAGTGSTGVAALKHGCEVILFEKESLFCQIIEDKLSVL